MALRTQPGSVFWLLGHDARLAWRDFRAAFRAMSDRTLVLLVVVLLGVLHAAAWPIARNFPPTTSSASGRSLAYVEAAPAVLFVILLLIAQSLNGITKLLYSRGDLDLILSSPVSARKVLFVRALAVAGGALVSASVFVIPFADVAVLTGHFRLAAIYPALLGAALWASAIGLMVALGLFALVGPRMTRLAAQILATFIGAGFMLGLQLHRFLPAVSLTPLLTDPRPSWVRVLVLMPVRAGLGEPAWLFAWMAVSGGLFCLATLILGQRFTRSAILASSMASGPARPATAPIASSGGRRAFESDRFRGGLMANLRLKEWKLIARDPWVVSQILLQILYMTPMAALLWSEGGSVALALGPMVAVVAFQVASSLTWLGLSGEDAPELLATAPVASKVLRRGKFEAVGALTLAIIALPLAWLAAISPVAAALTLPLVAAGMGCAILLQLWHSAPRRRSTFAARHRESKLLALIEMAVSILLGVTTALVVVHSLWALVPFGALAGCLLCARPRNRKRQEQAAV